MWNTDFSQIDTGGGALRNVNAVIHVTGRKVG